MSPLNAGREFNPKPNENEKFTFADKLRDLLPGIEFEESTELFEARTAVLEALTKNRQGPHFLRPIWIEYAKICEQIVDTRTDTDPQIRAPLQVAILVHKALIFLQAKNMRRYGEDLRDAAEYAYNMHFEEIVEAIDIELDNLTS